MPKMKVVVDILLILLEGYLPVFFWEAAFRSHNVSLRNFQFTSPSTRTSLLLRYSILLVTHFRLLRPLSG